jgi:hypothetical protein
VASGRHSRRKHARPARAATANRLRLCHPITPAAIKSGSCVPPATTCGHNDATVPSKVRVALSARCRTDTPGAAPAGRQTHHGFTREGSPPVTTAGHDGHDDHDVDTTTLLKNIPMPADRADPPRTRTERLSTGHDRRPRRARRPRRGHDITEEHSDACRSSRSTTDSHGKALHRSRPPATTDRTTLKKTSGRLPPGRSTNDSRATARHRSRSQATTDTTTATWRRRLFKNVPTPAARQIHGRFTSDGSTPVTTAATMDTTTTTRIRRHF